MQCSLSSISINKKNIHIDLNRVDSLEESYLDLIQDSVKLVISRKNGFFIYFLYFFFFKITITFLNLQKKKLLFMFFLNWLILIISQQPKT